MKTNYLQKCKLSKCFLINHLIESHWHWKCFIIQLNPHLKKNEEEEAKNMIIIIFIQLHFKFDVYPKNDIWGCPQVA